MNSEHQRTVRFSMRGRTDAAVSQEMPVKMLVDGSWQMLRFSHEQSRVFKQCGDPVIGQIEYDLYTKLAEQGISVPKVYGFDGKTLELAVAEGLPFTTGLGLQMFTCTDDRRTDDFRYQFGDFIGKALEFSASVNAAVDASLTDTQKQYLQRKHIENISSRNGVTLENAARYQHAYRAAESLGINDEQFLVQYEPLAAQIAEADRKYGMWIWGGDVRNLFVRKGGTFEAIDFNNPQFTAMQTSDSYLLDAYLPIKNFRNTLYLPSPLTESDRIMMLAYRFRMCNDHTPENLWDRGVEYVTKAYPMRIARNIRQYGHSMNEARATTDPVQLYDAMCEAQHAAMVISHHLEHMKNECADIGPVALRITDQMTAQLASMDGKFKHAEAWIYSNS